MKINARSIAALEKIRMELMNWQNRYASDLWRIESHLLKEAAEKIKAAASRLGDHLK